MGPSLDKASGKGNGPGFVSNTGMEHPKKDPQAVHGSGSDTDQRLTELEIKASFAEDLLEQLDKVIVRQQQQIDALLREVADLKAAPVRDGDITTARSLRDDLPPHF